MAVDIAYIAFSLFLLFLGAESLVKGSASFALRVGLSRLMVGLTIVAFGTSGPELVVSIKAALTQQGDISVANVVGSNSFNIGVILGLTALVCPIPINRQIIKIDAPIALGVALLLPFLMWDGSLGLIEGFLLFSGIIAYTWMSFTRGRRMASLEQSQVSVPLISKRWSVDLVCILSGLGLLVLGSHLLVEHSVSLAKILGISEAVVGLTIVAAGTSMPELATSLVAAIRKQPDIAIGNIVGSNIFNILAILGLGSMISPIHAPGISTLDYAAMIIFTMLLIPFIYTGLLLRRLEGVALLILYGVYLFMLWPR